MKGSKYIQSATNSIFKDVEKVLSKDRIVYFSGTPCQIFALKSFLKQDYSKLITQEIICHGVPSPYVWQKYIDYLERKNSSRISNFCFRDKTNGWSSYSISCEFDSGQKILEPAKNNEYFISYMMGMHNRYCCSNCKYKNLSKNADITLGDFWGIDKICNDFADNTGVSLVIINTQKGNQLFNHIIDHIIYKEFDHFHAVQYNPSLIKSTDNHVLRETFLREAQALDFPSLFNKFCSRKIHSRLRRKIAKLFRR